MLKYIYSDGAPEIIKALRGKNIVQERSTTGKSQNNGVIERANRIIEDGARTLLIQAGLPTHCWSFAVPHFSFSYNIAKRLDDGEDSSWNKRHGQGQFKGQLIPFGALVDFVPQPDVAEHQPKFDAATVPGVFLGYILRPGGAFKGDYRVADLRVFEEYDLKRDAKRKRFKVQTTKTIWLPKDGSISFPLKGRYDALNRALSIPT